MKRLWVILAGAMVALPATAATVTVTPPPYTIQPPQFRFTIPDAAPGSVNLKPLTDRLAADEAALSALSDRVGALEVAITKLGPPPPPPPPPGPVATSDPCASGQKWSTLTVDPTVSIGKALACANPGFKLTLNAGTYNQVFDIPPGLDGYDIGGVGADKVKISGQGGCTVAENNAGGCGTRLSWGKGVAHVQSSGTIHDIEVADGGSRAAGGHDGQAGIYIDQNAAGTILLRRIMFRNNENGLFANSGNSTADIVVQDSDFVGNGTGDGGSHSAYIAGGKSLTLNNIHDYGSNNGNDQKSRVPVVQSNGGFYRSTGGRWIECADGCVLTINGGTFVGQTFGQNVFGNGTESNSKGPGNTTWTGPSTVWVGRASDFANTGTFQAAGVTVLCGDGGSIFNDKGTPLNGLPGCTAGAAPADPPYVSGAK